MAHEPFRAECPHCKHVRALNPDHAGKRGECSNCASEFYVPDVSKPFQHNYGITPNEVRIYEEELRNFRQNAKPKNGDVTGIGFFIGLIFGGYFIFTSSGSNDGIIESLFLVFFMGLLGAMCIDIPMQWLSSALNPQPQTPREPNGLAAFKAQEVRYAVSVAEAQKKLGKSRKELAELELNKRRQTSNFWLSLDGYRFENEMVRIFQADGFEAARTKLSGDGGVDIRLKRQGKNYIVQCKAHKKPVGPAVAREIFGVMQHEKADGAYIASVGGFTGGAQDFVKGKNIKLVDLNYIIEKAEALSK